MHQCYSVNEYQSICIETVVYVCNEIIDKLKSNLIREVHDDLKVLLEIRGENVLEDEVPEIVIY